MHRTAKPARAILCQIAQKRLTFAPDSRAGNRVGRRSRQRSLSALAAIRRQSHIPVADPVNGSDRERRSGKRCWVLCDRSHTSVAKQAKMRCPVSLSILNAWAMLQLSSTACSSVSAMSAVFAPRMSNDENRNTGTGGPSTSVITKVKPKTKRPNLYRVLILNDDYTPMEFVVHVLEKFFQKDAEAATKIMLHVHHHGIGECGVFTYEIAETKVTQVMDFARKHQHPLQCVMEKK
jgi:ATP-dependent Clp protease adaptor protein ClpS